MLSNLACVLIYLLIYVLEDAFPKYCNYSVMAILRTFYKIFRTQLSLKRQLSSGTFVKLAQYSHEGVVAVFQSRHFF